MHKNDIGFKLKKCGNLKSFINLISKSDMMTFELFTEYTFQINISANRLRLVTIICSVATKYQYSSFSIFDYDLSILLKLCAQEKKKMTQNGILDFKS